VRILCAFSGGVTRTARGGGTSCVGVLGVEDDIVWVEHKDEGGWGGWQGRHGRSRRSRVGGCGGEHGVGGAVGLGGAELETGNDWARRSNKIVVGLGVGSVGVCAEGGVRLVVPAV
jgi:hypothetical protein